MSIPRAGSCNIDGTIVSTTMRSLVKTTASSFQPATDSELLTARSAGQQVSRSASWRIGRTEHDRSVTQRNVLCRGSRAIRSMRGLTAIEPGLHAVLRAPQFHLIHLKVDTLCFVLSSSTRCHRHASRRNLSGIIILCALIVVAVAVVVAADVEVVLRYRRLAHAGQQVSQQRTATAPPVSWALAAFSLSFFRLQASHINAKAADGTAEPCTCCVRRVPWAPRETASASRHDPLPSGHSGGGSRVSSGYVPSSLARAILARCRPASDTRPGCHPVAAAGGHWVSLQ